MTTQEKAKIIARLRGKSLRDLRPDLAKEWHPTLNGDLTPEMVKVGSNKKVWWYFPYDDPKTGKHFDFEWETTIVLRTERNIGCPFISGRYAWPGFNDLATTNPELIAEWHPTKNGSLTPEMISAGSTKKVWWYLPYDDIKTGKHFDFEWETSVSNRTDGTGCPFLSGRAVWQGFNDLATVSPKLAAEWHPTKNGDLTPEMVTAGSNKKVWWLLPYKNPKTGNLFNLEWESVISRRASGATCPFITGHAVCAGFNDLATTNPELAVEWHPTKNGKLTPRDVSASSSKKVWWFLPYDDAATGKHFDFEWEAEIHNRTNGDGCPFLSGHAVCLGFNDLATIRPDVAKEWHPTKNGDLTPQNVSSTSGRKVWWLLSYDDPQTGKHFDFEWEATIAKRTFYERKCPFLSGQAIWLGFNDLATFYPDVAKEWHPTKNGKITPHDVTCVSGKKMWWRCSNGHEWCSAVSHRTQGHNCPNCKCSKGEDRISDFFNNHNILSESQYTFEDCVFKNKLRFDHAVFAKNGELIFLVEYDGEQHFKPIAFSSRCDAKKSFEATKIRDNIKNEYCQKNRIPLIRISYKDYDNIEGILLRKLVRHGLM